MKKVALSPLVGRLLMAQLEAYQSAIADCISIEASQSLKTKPPCPFVAALPAYSCW